MDRRRRGLQVVFVVVPYGLLCLPMFVMRGGVTVPYRLTRPVHRLYYLRPVLYIKAKKIPLISFCYLYAPGVIVVVELCRHERLLKVLKFETITSVSEEQLTLC